MTHADADALIAAYRVELARLHGTAYVQATYVKYRRGRFLIHLPARMPDRLYAGEKRYAHSYHWLALELMVARLQARETTSI